MRIPLNLSESLPLFFAVSTNLSACFIQFGARINMSAPAFNFVVPTIKGAMSPNAKDVSLPSLLVGLVPSILKLDSSVLFSGSIPLIKSSL